MERLETKYWETIEKLGYWPGYIMIEDLEGIGYQTFSPSVLKVVKEIVRINQNYYPEMLRKMFILNVPSYFYVSWKVIQGWMEQRSVAKIELINGNARTIMDKITAIFDISSLPPRLCGTGAKDIPQGGLLGGHVPSWREPPHNRVDISRGSRYELKITAKEGDTIFWEFKTVDFDIGFSITSVKHKKEISPYERVDCSKMVIDGSFNIEVDDTYVLAWDNTYSWTRGKTLEFNIYSGGQLLKF